MGLSALYDQGYHQAPNAACSYSRGTTLESEGQILLRYEHKITPVTAVECVNKCSDVAESSYCAPV